MIEENNEVDATNTDLLFCNEVHSYFKRVKEEYSLIIISFIDKTNTFYNIVSGKLGIKNKSSNNIDESKAHCNDQWSSLIEKHKELQINLHIYLNDYYTHLSGLIEVINQLNKEESNRNNNDNDPVLLDPIYKHTITSEDNYKEDIDILKKHYKTLNHIQFININQYHNYIPSPLIKDTNLESITISNGKWDSTITNLNDNNINITNKHSPSSYPKLSSICFNNIKQVKSKSLLSFPLFSSFSLQHNCFPMLQILKFDKMDLINSEFDIIFKDIILNTAIRKTLRILSLEDNSITRIELKNVESSICDELREFNVKNNKVFIFKWDYDKFPSIQLINLINNRISIESDIDFPNTKSNNSILLLCNGNSILTQQHILESYNAKLSHVLSHCIYPMSSMSLERLFNSNCQLPLQSLKFNTVAFASLIELNIANCGLTSESVMIFLNNNKHMVNLERLDLNNNMITISFFNLFLKDANEKGKDDQNEDKGLEFPALRYLDLSCNLIEESDFSYVKEFVNLNQKLMILKVELNPFCLNYTAQLLNKNDEKQIQDDIMSNTVVKKQNDKFDFAVFFNEISESRRELYIDFSTESRIITHIYLREKQYKAIVKKKR